MPNHVSNNLEIVGEELDVGACLDRIQSKDDKENIMYIDFEKIIPRPKEFNIEPHMGIISAAKWTLQEGFSVTETGQIGPDKALQPDDIRDITHALEIQNSILAGSRISEFTDEDFDQFIKVLNCKRKYGEYYWYDFNISNWGTKWNAYEQKMLAPNILYFETAWSPPCPVIEELSQMFPKLKFNLSWADEDIGSHQGCLRYHVGVSEDGYNLEDAPDTDRNAYFFKLNPDIEPSSYGYNDKFEYVEEDE